jgi:carboxymethylenebutenolidase
VPDLEALWEEHCRYEFETRDVDATMATMVDEPYVNHIPTMTGGVGHDELKRFYKYHFIGANPPDIKLVPVSRTVGTDSLVDEMLVSFTHTSEIDLDAARRAAHRPHGRGAGCRHCAVP